MPVVEPVVLERLAQAHQTQLSTIQIAAEAAAMDLWFSVGGVDDDSLDRWNTGFWRIVSAAGTASSESTHSYLGWLMRYAGISPPLPQPDMGWLEDDFAAWANTPVIGARTAISEGAAYNVAMTDVGPKVKKLTSAVTRTAEQEAFDQIIDSQEWGSINLYTGEIPTTPLAATMDTMDDVVLQANRNGYPTVKNTSRAFKWSRVPQAGACGWCRVVADRRYSDKSKTANPLGAWHTFCRCSWRMLTVKESQDWESKYSDDWQEVIKEPAVSSDAAQSGEQE